MKVQDRLPEKESAISPVIGIMLMLVVTIVIAAVVAAFSTGVLADAEPAPNAVLDVSIDASYVATMGTYPVFELKYLSGDTNLDTSKMSFDFVWTNPHADDEGHGMSYYPRTVATHVDAESMAEYATSSESSTIQGLGSCLLNPYIYYLWGSSDSHPSAFGKYVLEVGQTMITPTIYMYAENGGEVLTLENEAMYGLFGSADVLIDGESDPEEMYLATILEEQLSYDNSAELHVTIVYDNKHILFDKVVTVA